MSSGIPSEFLRLRAAWNYSLASNAPPCSLDERNQMNNSAILLVIFATLNACSSETATYAEATDDGAGGADSSASSTLAVEAPQAGGSTALATTTQAVDEVEPLCVPGQSVACACPDGATSAQVCASDGQSYVACDCGPAEVVEPAGYTGACVVVGPVPSACPVGDNLYINCAAKPNCGAASCHPTIGDTAIASSPGVYCCPC